MRNMLMSLAGAIVGAVVGYFGFGWFWHYGFYALVLPGGLMGIGASAGRIRSLPLAFVVGVAAVLMGFFTEWSYRPFQADESLGYFLTHLYKLSPVTYLMIAVGGLIGFWGLLDPWGRARAGKWQ